MKTASHHRLKISTESNCICPVCTSSLHQIAGGYLMCKVCKYMMSNEQPGAGAEVVSLEVVREKNFRLICKKIKEKFPQSHTVLDVGCSTGHFLKVAADEGLSASGLEPAMHLTEKLRAEGYDVINGFFPYAESLSGKMYDIIIFNDSFEHIPNLQAVLQGTKDHLKKNGIIIINLPSSNGVIFKTAFFLNKLGIRTPFNRLWQKGFASPHLHYFNARNLKRLLANTGFVMEFDLSLFYYTIKGLWGRISCKSPFFVSISTWICMVLLYPLITLSSDCFMACFSFVENDGENL